MALFLLKWLIYFKDSMSILSLILLKTILAIIFILVSSTRKNLSKKDKSFLFIY